MATNEGVGKKIVEALKKQTETEIELMQDFSGISEEQKNENSDFSKDNISEFESSEIDKLYDASSDIEDTSEKSNEFEIQETSETINEISQKSTESNRFETTVQTMPKQPQGWDFSINEEPQAAFVQPLTGGTGSGAKQFDMPPNVAVLKRLITQLPSGVTKQTGAQIIKQTMEALGISMNTVLHEAQKVQDDMNESIKNCMTSIQEYKNNIKSLEKQGLDYQRQVNQLNDLISLFILSDKD